MTAPALKRTRKPASARAAAKAVQDSPAVSKKQSDVSPRIALDSEEVARLAFSYWESRGCQGGSPEEDWYRAEETLEANGAAGTNKRVV